ncbi:MAG: hypothetical protein ACE5IP_07585 [Terriglobia bacterium]
MGIKPEKVDELAQAAAARVVGHVQGEKLISRFIDSYVMGFDRRQLKSPVDKFRQRADQLGQEALVLLGLLVVEQCCQRLYRFKLGPLVMRDRQAARRFAESFWPAVGGQLKLDAGVPAGWARRAEEYRTAPDREARFSEQVAPLLDPAPQMKDNAEHAGRKFFEALSKVSIQVTTRLLAGS